MNKMDVTLLYIDTSTKICSVGLAVNGTQVALQETGNEQYEHGEKITLLIKDCLAEANLKIKDLNGVCLTSGPGSYTGLRIGTSTAKGICYALNIPLLVMDALTSLAIQAQMKHPNRSICAMIDARRMEVFSTIYDQHLQVIKPISADVLDEMSYSDFTDLLVVGDGAEKCKELWDNRSYDFDLSIKTSVVGLFEKGYQLFQEEKFQDVAYFEPLYVKEFYSTAKIVK